MTATVEDFDWESLAFLGEVPDLPEQWGLRSEHGVVTVAKEGEGQSRSWLSYSFPGTIGPVQERLVHRLGDGEWRDAA